MSDAITKELPAEAQAVWLAYQAMGKSKDAYFSFLQELHQKYRDNGSSTFAENLRLEKLLQVHNEKVTAFSQAMSAVKDRDTRERLVRMMGALGKGAGMM